MITSSLARMAPAVAAEIGPRGRVVRTIALRAIGRVVVHVRIGIVAAGTPERRGCNGARGSGCAGRYVAGPEAAILVPAIIPAVVPIVIPAAVPIAVVVLISGPALIAASVGIVGPFILTVCIGIELGAVTGVVDHFLCQRRCCDGRGQDPRRAQ